MMSFHAVDSDVCVNHFFFFFLLLCQATSLGRKEGGAQNLTDMKVIHRTKMTQNIGLIV